MTPEELQAKALTLYDEYHPQQSIDNDLSLFIHTFLQTYMNDFLCLLPAHCIGSSFTASYSNPIATPINYKGGCITLPSDFLKLNVFRMSDWERSVYPEEVISSSHPHRKLQDNKFTSGKISRPVVSIEQPNGVLSLCFWQYGDNAAVKEFSYTKKAQNLTDFAALDDYLLTAYIYFVLHYVFTTTQDLQLAQNSIQEMQSILLLHNIMPSLPVTFNTAKK